MAQPGVLCIHESGTSGRVWSALAGALGPEATVDAPDRPGWGAAPAPEGYARTTIAEQAAHAGEHLGARPILAGSGIGAVIALELALRRPGDIAGLLLIEPPLLSFLPAATEQLSADAATIRDAVAAGGREAALDAYLDGQLLALGAGAERIPAELKERGPAAATSLFAEVAAVPAWNVTDDELASLAAPALVVVSEASPPLLDGASRKLAKLLPRAELREIGPGLPHTDQAASIADLACELADA